MISLRYLQVKIEVEHDEAIDPVKVINECWYKFQSNTEKAVIADTEIQEISDKPFQV